MSNVGNVHQFNPLDKNSEALSGQRLVRLIAKKNKSGEYESPNLAGSLCVSVPQLSVDAVVDRIDVLVPHVMSMIRDVQDKIIREWRIAHGRNEIPEEVFNVNACIGWLEKNAAGETITAQYMEEWFIGSYAAIASEWIASNLTMDPANPTVIHKVNILKDMFVGWHSPKYSPNIPQLKTMLRFMDTVECDARMDTLAKRARQLLQKKEQELSTDALGF